MEAANSGGMVWALWITLIAFRHDLLPNGFIPYFRETPCMKVTNPKYSSATFVFILLSFFVLAAPTSATGAELRLPLTVSNTLSQDRWQEPVSSGVPLPEGYNIVGTDNLILTESDGVTEVPAQFRVLSRWGPISNASKPLKWLLVDFHADVPANAKAVYYLKTSAKHQRHKGRSGISTREDSKKIVVDTGPLRFSVSKKRFNLFDEVFILENEDANQRRQIVSSTKANGIVIRRGKKVYSSSFSAPHYVAVEERGALRTVVVVKGRFASEDGTEFVGGDARGKPYEDGRPASQNHPLEYTVRISAYAGKSYAKVVYTLENNGNGYLTYHPINDVFIDANYVVLKPNLSSSTVATADSTSAEMDKSDGLVLVQGHSPRDKNDESKNFCYTITKNQTDVKKGARSAGWLDLSDEQRGITVWIRSFWQKFPKSIEVQNGELKIGILPDNDTEWEKGHYAEGNHYFSGGWHMTNEIFFYFHAHPARAAKSIEVITSLSDPLFASCSPGWFADSKAWGLIGPSGTESADGMTEKALSRYEMFQRMFIDPRVSLEHKSIETLRETRNLGKDHYGWENFGDLAWKWQGGVGPYCALHYDWPYIMWLQFVRTGDERFLGLAQEMTEHSMDMDQIHGFMDDGIWWWEDQGQELKHHKSYIGWGRGISHTWNGGYTLGYLLTGDNRYLNAAQRSANAGRAFWRKAISGQKVKFDQTRSQGWSILMLVNEYRITGDVDNLKQAMAIFSNSLLYTEQLPTSPGSNGKGYILVEKYHADPKMEGKAVVTFLSYPLEPLCELHLEASKAGLDVTELEAYLIRSLNWLRDCAYVGGTTKGAGGYSYLTISYATDPADLTRNNGGTLAHNIHVAGAFGYGCLMLKDKDSSLANAYLDFARQLFKDLMFYRTENHKEKGDYHSPTTLSPISWGWLPTATKEMAWIGRGGQFYLYSEYEISKQ